MWRWVEDNVPGVDIPIGKLVEPVQVKRNRKRKRAEEEY
jgi:hypothetical protein